MTDDSLVERTQGREFTFDRHGPDYRLRLVELAEHMQSTCPVAWNDTYGGHWFAAANKEVFDIARSADKVSNARDATRGYKGNTIPPVITENIPPSFLEMDPPDQRYYRQTLNPYLSPAAVARWKPVAAEITRAALNEKIETGSIDFVDDLANIVPAALTLAMMGLPLKDWPFYCEPAHAAVYIKPDDPDLPKVIDMMVEMSHRLQDAIVDVRTNPRPGLVQALATCTIDGRTPSDEELTGQLNLIIGGGFDTTTALTAHALEWLSEHADQRERLSRERDALLDSATEEFLRFYTPAPGDGRTISQDCEIAGVRFKEGERLWLDWAMANRDPKVFPTPNEVLLDRTNNRHASFGLGIHRCIGSNVARMTFKTMLTAVLDRMPDFVCDTARAVHYDTVGVINGMKHLPATFTPAERMGPGLDETLEILQRACDEQRLAEPVTVHRAAADLGTVSR
jgi:cytochrome P450